MLPTKKIPHLFEAGEESRIIYAKVCNPVDPGILDCDQNLSTRFEEITPTIVPLLTKNVYPDYQDQKI